VQVSFDQPVWLWLIALAVPLAAAGAMCFSAMSRVRRWSAIAVRVVLLALLSAMLAGASAVRRTDKVAVVAVVDVSDSVRLFGQGVSGQADAVASVRQWLSVTQQRRRPDDVMGVVAFAGSAAAVITPTRGDLSDRALDIALRDGTDIAGALRLAATLIPPESSGRLVLISDGIATTGEPLAAARQIGRGIARSTPIDVVPIAIGEVREVMVESVDAPPRAAAGATITVRITLRSTGEASGTLQLTREGELVDINGEEPGTGRRLTLRPGRTVELVTVPLPEGRLHRFEAVFTPDRVQSTAGGVVSVGDSRVENNRAQGMTVSTGRGAVLLVDGVNSPGGPGGGGLLGRTLAEADMDVTTIPPEAMPESLLELQAYDTVVLENVPADAVTNRAQRALVAFVKDTGGGLVVVGGPDALGAGGWKGSEVEPILPVKLDLPEKLVQPDAAVVFVLDNSGSMGRGVLGSVLTQQQIANQAAALAVRSLDSKDLVSVITFNSTSSVVVPLSPNTDAKATASRILSIAPGGGTVMGPALLAARDQLAEVRAAVKHIIVLSDGRSVGHETLPQIAEQIHVETGATISAISVGDEADEQTMADMAQRGGGQSYVVTNPNLLPKFFLKAVRIIRTPMVRQGTFQPVVEPVASPFTAGLSNPPPLLGLVLTQRRPEPTITYSMSADTGEPLMAHWNVELGQVAVFASDASRWARLWAEWPGYRRMWTQVARGVAKSTAASPFELTMEAIGDELKLRMDAVGADGKPVDGLTVPVTVHSPGGSTVSLFLSQVGPGVYEGSARTPETGAHIAVVKPSQNGRAMAGLIGGASVASGAEFQRLTPDRELLEQIARETGGRMLSLADGASIDLFDRTGTESREAVSPLWRLMLIWTLAVFLLDVGMRRIAWDRFVSREFGVDVRRAAAESVADRSRQARRAVERLKTVIPDERPGVVGQAGLSDDDAQRVEEQERARRLAAYQAKMQAVRRQEFGVESVEDTASTGMPAASTSQEPRRQPEQDAGGLMAAKRRARERMERQGGGEGGEV
jgi:uncharacterized membrane protein